MIFVRELLKIRYKNLILLKTIYNLNYQIDYLYYQYIPNNNLILYELNLQTYTIQFLIYISIYFKHIIQYIL